MKKPTTTTAATIKKIPAGIIRGKLYDKKTNVLVALLIKQDGNNIRHVF